MRRALVLFSGGMDSTVVLGETVQEYGPEETSALCVAYGQPHSAEVDAARRIAAMLGVRLLIARLSGLALTAPSGSYVVPGRNATLISMAHATAQSLGASVVRVGICQDDARGFPDCSDAFLSALGKALDGGAVTPVALEAPLIGCSKAEVFFRAAHAQVLSHVIGHSVTCYRGDSRRNDWGMGCGACPSCLLRKRGWGEFTAKGMLVMAQETGKVL